MRRAFTLIELLIVTAIIGVLLVTAVTSVTAGRSAAHARTAARGVAQMSHYASALAILRQKRVEVVYRGNAIDVRVRDGDSQETVARKVAAPIYREVAGEDAAVPEADGEPEETDAEDGSSVAEETGMFFTRRVLDPRELAQENATRAFPGVVFAAELTDEAGGVPRARSAASFAAGTNSLSPAIFHEANGFCTPHRVTIREEDGETELMVVDVARSGKVTIGADGEDARK